MRSQTQDVRLFYLFLIGFLLLHCGMMATQIRDFISHSTTTSSKIIKLKLIQEALQSSTTAKRQIVQSEDSAIKEKRDKAFLSDKDRAFERETMAKTIEKFNKAALGNSSVTQDAQKAPKQNQKNAKNIKLSDLGIAAGFQAPETMERAPATKSTKGMENGDAQSIGLSATNDYVEEVKLGDFTQLNTVEYKYYGFVHRIRQKLEQFWGNSIQEKATAIFRSGRRLPASENLVTSLQVTLNEKGEIIGVKVMGASGVKELDDAAVESFNKAGPFPNPPQGLLVNGKATIEWGFVVKS